MIIKQYDYLPQDARLIRTEVFIREQGFTDEFDETDDIAVHIVAYENSVPIAVCRVFHDEGKQAYLIGRIAVLKEMRGKHVGEKIVAAAEKYIKSKGGGYSMLSAQVRVKSFYSKQGYVEEGNVYLDEDCPHILMKKKLD